MRHRPKKRALLSLVLLPGLAASAEPLTVAVASNFVPVAEEIGAQFAQQTGHAVRISSGSTGKLYAQISNGAPYDVFLSADSERPALLVASKSGVAETRMTYAVGSLVLWSRDSKFEESGCPEHLQDLGKDHLAIANPETAPYGAAARDYLIQAGMWERVRPQLVYGENISQTLQFVASGNASMGLIAKSQSVDTRLPQATCSWPVPTSTHRALEQQAVLLARAAGDTVAMSFLDFLTSPSAREIIVRHGYTLPE